MKQKLLYQLSQYPRLHLDINTKLLSGFQESDDVQKAIKLVQYIDRSFDPLVAFPYLTQSPQSRNKLYCVLPHPKVFIQEFFAKKLNTTDPNQIQKMIDIGFTVPKFANLFNGYSWSDYVSVNRSGQFTIDKDYWNNMLNRTLSNTIDNVAKPHMMVQDFSNHYREFPTDYENLKNKYEHALMRLIYNAWDKTSKKVKS